MASSTPEQARPWPEDLICTLGATSVRSMFGMRVFFAGGRMFAALGDAELLLKLPATVRDDLAARGLISMLPTGAGVAFGDWIALPLASWESRWPELSGLVEQSRTLVRAPKPAAQDDREQRGRFRKRQY